MDIQLSQALPLKLPSYNNFFIRLLFFFFFNDNAQGHLGHFLSVIGSLCLRKDFWDRHRPNCNSLERLLATHSFLLTRVSLSYLVLVPAPFLTLRHLLPELLVVALAHWPLESLRYHCYYRDHHHHHHHRKECQLHRHRHRPH